MQDQAANNHHDSYIVQQQVVNNNDTDDNESTTTIIRRGKLLTLLGITGFDERNDGIVREGSLYTTVAAFLAWKELQGRSDAILPHLPMLVEKCPDFHWVYEARDTNFAPLQAAQELLTAMGQHRQHDDQYHHDTMVSNNNNNNNNSNNNNSTTILGEPTQQPDHEVVIVTQEELEEIANVTGTNNMTPLPVQQALNATITPTWPTIAPSTRPVSTQTPLFSPTTSPTTNSNSFSSRIPPTSIPTFPRTALPRETDPPLTEDQFVFQRGYSHNEYNGQSQQQQQQQQQQSSSSLSNNGNNENNGRQLSTSSESTNIYNNSNNNQYLRPFGMIGAFSSRVSDTLSTLGDALSVPQVSGSSTSADLNLAPLFARTIGTDDGQAEAFIHYMMHLGVTHVANIFSKDSYGTAFYQSLSRHARDNGIRLRGIPYLEGQELKAIQSLRETQYRYVYATIVGWEALVQTAFEQEVLGVSGYAWFLSEKFFLTYPNYEVPKQQPGLAHALSGIGLVNVHVASHEALDQAMDNFVTNTSMQQEYIASHAHPEIFDNFTFPPHTIHSNQYLYFDAVLALGLASCYTPGLFTGPELYEQLLTLEFQGVTGNVSFDEHGNRAFNGLQYRIDNLRLSENRSDLLYCRFESKLTAVVGGSNNITQVNPFLFPDGAQGLTSRIPATLPPVEMDFKFIPGSARIVGYVLGSSIMLLSLATIAWTWRARETYVIKAAQPPFLIQICIGTLVMASAVFPLSFEGGGQDEWIDPKKYNVACQSALWLLLLGFVISVSAILAKTWRLNKVMSAGAAIRRIQIEAKDVMPPFVGLMTINVTMLLCLTLVAPYEFRRTNMSNYDHFDRSVESYGHCELSSNLSYAFLVPMIFVNTLCVFMAAIQLYKARNLPMDFSETRYLGLSMAFLLETVFLSAPVLIALKIIPTAYFLFATIAICVLCLTILVPVFLPKFLHRKSKNQGKRALANLIAQHQVHSRASQFDTGMSTYAMAPQSRRGTQFDQAYSIAVGDCDGSDDNSNRSSRSSRNSYGVMKLHRK